MSGDVGYSATTARLSISSTFAFNTSIIAFQTCFRTSFPSFRAGHQFARCLESSIHQIPALRLMSQRTSINNHPASIFRLTGKHGGDCPTSPLREPLAVLPSAIKNIEAWAARGENDLGLAHHATLLVRRAT